MTNEYAKQPFVNIVLIFYNNTGLHTPCLSQVAIHALVWSGEGQMLLVWVHCTSEPKRTGQKLLTAHHAYLSHAMQMWIASKVHIVWSHINHWTQ